MGRAVGTGGLARGGPRELAGGISADISLPALQEGQVGADVACADPVVN